MRILAAALTSLLVADAAHAACVNRFVARTERAQQVVTLLTGKLTFQEAQDLAAKIKAGQASRLEWVSDDGKVLSKQVGDLKVVRPMPVGCDGKSSGVVVVATFLSVSAPAKKMNVKLDANTTVMFEQQQ
ncbi:MAG TPA: hypothetical protein VE010_10405 [Thermoanaerobaculia bacterium]|nr:hypothetical protein [Thermoanaerobaculia bacterium]